MLNREGVVGVGRQEPGSLTSSLSFLPSHSRALFFQSVHLRRKALDVPFTLSQPTAESLLIKFPKGSPSYPGTLGRACSKQ